MSFSGVGAEACVFCGAALREALWVLPTPPHC